MASNVTVKGLAELNQVLQSLPVKIERNVLRGAMRAGSKVFLDLARQAAPVDAGDLKESLRVSTSAKRGTVKAEVKAGGTEKVFYAHMIEYGTASFYTGSGKSVGKPYTIAAKDGGALSIAGGLYKSVQHPGIKPTPFMRDSFDKGTDESLKAFAQYVEQRLPKELKKAGR